MREDCMSWKPVPCTLALCLITVLLLALPVATFAAKQPLAELENGGTKLVFYPVTEFAELILTVNGPCDFQFREVILPGGVGVFYLDKTTIDGAYTYNLMRVEEIDPSIIKVLLEARQNDDSETPKALCRDGKLPAPPLSQSEGFLVSKSVIIYDPSLVEEEQREKNSSVPFARDFLINDDLIVDGSACIGFDCVNGESFGFDTIRVKENNLRIKFQDTSTAASFPDNVWQLTANDSANGGSNKFSIDDISGGRTPFTVEANARSHSLYVDDGGRIGNRTSTPSTEIHTVDGDTPTLRLQQDGSSGFTPQTWDVAGNETSFFIRDVTNGSQLPFRIRPGAPTSSIDISSDGEVGVGTASPSAPLHVLRSDGSAQLLVQETNGSSTLRNLLQLSNNGPAAFVIENTSGGTSPAWEFVGGAGGGANLRIGDTVDANNEFILAGDGTLTITGSINTTDCSPCVSDYVFEPDYELMPLADLEAFVKREKHLPNVPSQGDVDRAGRLNMTEMQMKMLEKIEELALYTFQQQKTIDELVSQLKKLQSQQAQE